MTISSSNKRIVIIAGPGGAGKNTSAREFLPTDAGLPTFVNAECGWPFAIRAGTGSLQGYAVDAGDDSGLHQSTVG